MRALKIVVATLAAVCVLVSASICLADTNFSVEGYVFEKATGNPLAGANIYYYSGSTHPGYIKDTDANGFYHIDVDDHYGQPLRVMAQVVCGQPNPTYRSNIYLPYPPEDGNTYWRDIYVEIPQVTNADEGDLSVEVRVLPEVVTPTEPVYVNIYMRNNRNTEIRLQPEGDVGSSGGRFYITSMSDEYEFTELASPTTTFFVDAGYPYTHPYEYVPSHSYVCIKTYRLRHLLNGGLDEEVEPGYYRIRLDGSFSGEPQFSFITNAHLMVKESTDSTEVLGAINDVNTNIVYTQDTINTRMDGVEESLRSWSSRIHNYLRDIYHLLRFRWWRWRR